MLILTLTCSLAGVSTIHACAWDTDTLRDESVAKSDLYDLATGQFPHHGDAYYQQRIRNL